jgi:hypothetical protein
VQGTQDLDRFGPRDAYYLWQNRLNYSGSSVLMIAMQLSLTQRTSNGTIHWSVGSPPDTTTVQQDRSRLTSHEPSSNSNKLIQTMFKLTSRAACPNSQRREKITRLHTLRGWTPSSAQGLGSLRRVTASRGRVPFHEPAKRYRGWPCRVVHGILESYTWNRY